MRRGGETEVFVAVLYVRVVLPDPDFVVLDEVPETLRPLEVVRVGDTGGLRLLDDVPAVYLDCDEDDEFLSVDGH